ncbi:hypothetical protein OH76DRAFT_250934 [Lentinus brumalis]|uniref:Uncharacterized protein n=1 Tax=Lentinus brumalis TaxID=2498619 RepID=A0A371CLJ7_9APHY|nr:hypothetical protein OH76DRAFT_250934 [Polyporus brumalis]
MRSAIRAASRSRFEPAVRESVNVRARSQAAVLVLVFAHAKPCCPRVLSRCPVAHPARSMHARPAEQSHRWPAHALLTTLPSLRHPFLPASSSPRVPALLTSSSYNAARRAPSCTLSTEPIPAITRYPPDASPAPAVQFALAPSVSFTSPPLHDPRHPRALLAYVRGRTTLTAPSNAMHSSRRQRPCARSPEREGRPRTFSPLGGGVPPASSQSPSCAWLIGPAVGHPGARRESLGLLALLAHKY